MTKQAVHVLVFDGFADWEPAHALAELRRSGKRSVVAVGFDAKPVTSMGGLRVVPDKKLRDVRAAEVEMLIIPGGDLWEGSYPEADLNGVLTDLVSAKVPVAAICGATLAVARAGLLNDRRHTSNTPGYIAGHVPPYYGAAFYEPVPAVNDKGVITASGLAPIEFAREIFKQLRVFSPADEDLWFDMFKHGRLPQSAI
ncbi:MAG TPA: type 1 glutamine amidotransferase family protein [Gemmatimonadaceae bacterium]|nr:type 1 glutamine amidotransferase family protein [Gemmatimonadaceae bacterium]